MKRCYKLRNQIPVLTVGCLLVCFSTMIFYLSHARSQTRDNLTGSKIRIEPGGNKSEVLKKLRNRNVEALAKLDGIIYDLTRKERTLRIERQMLIQEISRGKKLTVDALTASSDWQATGITIEKVKRVTGGRPAKADMMVSVAQLGEVWKQMDYILDKLDEITELLSKRG